MLPVDVGVASREVTAQTSSSHRPSFHMPIVGGQRHRLCFWVTNQLITLCILSKQYCGQHNHQGHQGNTGITVHTRILERPKGRMTTDYSISVQRYYEAYRIERFSLPRPECILLLRCYTLGEHERRNFHSAAFNQSRNCWICPPGLRHFESAYPMWSSDGEQRSSSSMRCGH